MEGNPPQLLADLAQEPDRLKKTLKVLALITEQIRPLKPIVVGGAALEFYTLGGYTTKDVDLVVADRKRLNQVLRNLGFERTTGRHWYSDLLDLAIEAPDEALAGSEDKITTVVIGGKPVYLIGVEDLIIDRLAAAKYWQGCQEDFNLAVRLLVLHKERIDLKYLKEAAQRELVTDILKKALQKSREYLKKL
jgi:predicted nucleotidyltransferase